MIVWLIVIGVILAGVYFLARGWAKGVDRERIRPQTEAIRQPPAYTRSVREKFV